MSLLDTKIEYSFKNKDLLELSLTHKSYSQQNNERMEYLGDSLLNFVIADSIFSKFTDLSEGKMTQFRASLVSREVLNEIAKERGLEKFIKVGKGEILEGNSILGNTLEALVGAIYLDGGFDDALQVINFLFLERINLLETSTDLKDAKSKLQEYLQKTRGTLPVYHMLTEGDKKANKKFTVSCDLNNSDLQVLAQGETRKKAEIAAAQIMLEKLKEKDEQTD